MKTDLLKFYEDIMTTADVVVSENGMLDYNILDGEGKIQDVVPITLRLNETEKDLPLVLPTIEVLENADLNEVVVFHPATEVVYNGESETLSKLTNVLNIKLIKEFTNAFQAILELRANTAVHAGLTLSQGKLIDNLPDPRKTTGEYYASITRKITTLNFRIVSLLLRRGGEIDGVKYQRTCTLFPNILAEEQPLFDVNGSKDNIALVRGIYNKIIPKNLETGSMDKGCPYLKALLSTYVATAEHINKIRKTLGKHKGNIQHINVDWFEQVDDIKEMQKMSSLNAFPGNAGLSVNASQGEVSEKDDRIVMKRPGRELPKRQVGAPETKPTESSNVANVLKESGRLPRREVDSSDFASDESNTVSEESSAVNDMMDLIENSNRGVDESRRRGRSGGGYRDDDYDDRYSSRDDRGGRFNRGGRSRSWYCKW